MARGKPTAPTTSSADATTSGASRWPTDDVHLFLELPEPDPLLADLIPRFQCVAEEKDEDRPLEPSESESVSSASASDGFRHEEREVTGSVAGFKDTSNDQFVFPTSSKFSDLDVEYVVDAPLFPVEESDARRFEYDPSRDHFFPDYKYTTPCKSTCECFQCEGLSEEEFFSCLSENSTTGTDEDPLLAEARFDPSKIRCPVCEAEQISSECCNSAVPLDEDVLDKSVEEDCLRDSDVIEYKDHLSTETLDAKKQEYSSVIFDFTTVLYEEPNDDKPPGFWKDSGLCQETESLFSYDAVEDVKAVEAIFAPFPKKEQRAVDLLLTLIFEEGEKRLKRPLESKEKELMEMKHYDDIEESKLRLEWAVQRALEVKTRAELDIPNPYYDAFKVQPETIGNDFRRLFDTEQNRDAFLCKGSDAFPSFFKFGKNAPSLFDSPYSGDFVAGLSLFLEPAPKVERESDKETAPQHPRLKCKACLNHKHCPLVRHCDGPFLVSGNPPRYQYLLPGKERRMKQPPAPVFEPRSQINIFPNFQPIFGRSPLRQVFPNFYY